MNISSMQLATKPFQNVIVQAKVYANARYTEIMEMHSPSKNDATRMYLQ